MAKNKQTPPKFSKMNISQQNTLKATKTLLGLFALGVCFNAGYGCYQRSQQQTTQQNKTTMATLIDKKIIKKNGNKNHVVFWLDTNNDCKTAEGFCSMLNADSEKTSHISNLENGTTKSLADWQKIAHPYKVQHNPCRF